MVSVKSIYTRVGSFSRDISKRGVVAYQEMCRNANELAIYYCSYHLSTMLFQMIARTTKHILSDWFSWSNSVSYSYKLYTKSQHFTIYFTKLSLLENSQPFKISYLQAPFEVLARWQIENISTTIKLNPKCA